VFPSDGSGTAAGDGVGWDDCSETASGTALGEPLPVGGGPELCSSAEKEALQKPGPRRSRITSSPACAQRLDKEAHPT
jgi:hypothetical protein